MDSSQSDLKMDFMISSVTCVPGDVLIKFKGKYLCELEPDYHMLQLMIQRVEKVPNDLDIGEFCLVQDKPLGVWHRGNITNKFKERCEVVLIDRGDVIKVPFEQIASATGELFTLPPKVVNGIFSSVLPLGDKWSPRSINFFTSLVGERHNGQVKTTLPHQVVLLEVPKLINYAVELSVAKYIDSDTFRLLVELIHKSPANYQDQQMPGLLQQKQLTLDVPLSLNDNDSKFQKLLGHLKPEISVGTMVKINISAATSHDRFYCHLLSWEQELHKLTASMSSHYDSVKTDASSLCGRLCAAKRKDGLWYRGIIQSLLSCKHVKVLFIDIGSSETIQSKDVHQLKRDFLLLPMLAIPCTFSRVNYHNKSSRSMQLSLFKQALMGDIVIARIEDFCSEEWVFDISLYNKDHELNSEYHLTYKLVPIFSSGICTVKSEYEEESSDTALPEASVPREMDNENVVSVNAVKMDPDSTHVAYVEYVLNPSNFWIRTNDHQNEFTAMMAEIAERYDKSEFMDMMIDDPQPGQLCCALYANDCHYYRALITEVHEPKVSVYFIDFGNTETVYFYDLKVLLPEFSTLPGLAMCCSLAHAYPQDDVWVKSANDLFKKVVSGKALFCHVLEKQKFKYVVEVRLVENPDSSDVVSLLVQAGYAEFWKVDFKSRPVAKALPGNCRKHQGKYNKKSTVRNDIKISLSECKKARTNQQAVSFCEPSNNVSSDISPMLFKQYNFNPGAILDVKCSYVESPGHFWCQVSCNLTALDTLMDEIQTFYEFCHSRYFHGQTACIARSRCTGKYYRALIVKCVSRQEVDVIFVDYGIKERVFISELKEIKPQFLKWESQSFSCCLSKVLFYNAHHTWSASACKDFKGFVDSATDMKCTVIGVFSNGSKGLCNAVDLYTPCINANHWLASQGYLISHGTFKIPSVFLHSFCHSSFDLEVGSKASIYITYMYNSGKFYCQLAKNENNVEILMRKVFELGEKINPETANKVNDLCIVKHIPDGNFYRASASPVDSNHSLAFFVDFGDSHIVKKTKLLPIPQEAVDILFEPMQAIPCYLSGLKEATFTTEAKAWFEEQYMDTTVSATVISKDNQGELELDLCCKNVSINHELKGILGIAINPSNNASHTKCISTALPVCAEKHTLQDLSKRSDTNGKDKNTHVSYADGNVIPNVNSSFILYSHQNSMCEALQKEPLQNEASKPPSLMHVMNSCSPSSLKKPFKSTDLPKIILETGSTHLVYASHISSLSEFYIQLAENGKQVLQLEEELNDMSFQPINVNQLEKGFLVVAQYPENKAFYRADIKDILNANLFEVEFIDYGNIAKVDFSSIYKLPERFFDVPRLSISVFLTGVQKFKNDKSCQSTLDRFAGKLTNESFSCMFLGRHGSQWEVSINLEGQSAKELPLSFNAPPELSALHTKATSPKLPTKFLQSFKATPEFFAFNKKDTAPNLATDFPQSLNANPELSALDKKETVPTLATEFLQSFKTHPEISALDEKDIAPTLNATLKSNQIEKVKTIYLSESGRLFVTLVRFAEESKLSEEYISAVVEQSDSWLTDNFISEGMVCWVKSEKMKIWLRAIVEKICQRTKDMVVFYVDHCVREVVSMHKAKSLSARAQPLPHQAICCKWVWMENIGINLFQSRMQSMLPNKLHILFLKFLETEICWKVDLILDGIMLMEHFNTVSPQATQKLNGAAVCFQLETKSLTFSIPRGSLQSLQVHSGFVVAFQNPFNFSIQLENSVVMMNKLSKLIKELPDDLLPLNKDLLLLGSACLVKCFKFDQWCRAEIVSINRNSIKLNLPDHGVYKSVPYSDCNKLKVISKEIASIPALTYRCRLHGVLPKNGSLWPACAVEYCLDFIEDCDLLILPIILIENNVTEVSIYGQGNLAQKLVSQRLGRDAKNKGCFPEAVAESTTTVS